MVKKVADGGIRGGVIGSLTLLESIWVLVPGDGADSVKGRVFAQTRTKSERATDS